MTPSALERERIDAIADQALSRSAASIVPANSIAGRSLTAVIAIMTFLASLMLGAAIVVYHTARDWREGVSSEVTIQVRPIEGRDTERDVQQSAELARAISGVSNVRALSREDSARLLEPWLGTGLTLSELPVPRLIVMQVDNSSATDLGLLRQRLAEQVPAASLDDHRGFTDRMRAISQAAIGTAFVLLALVIGATVLSVAFATRGAMDTNRPIIEVLHFIGARENFIIREFQRHFLILGFVGASIGGAAAIALFAIAAALGAGFRDGAGESQIEFLFGSFALGAGGYAAILGLVAMISALTAATSRATVRRTLKAIE